MKTFLKLIASLLLIVLLTFAGFLAFVTYSALKPSDMEALETISRSNSMVNVDEPIRLISWNIGYAGLGSEMDFFYDGGKKVRAKRELADHYLEGVLSFIKEKEDVDFWLLQEVDFDAKRSYRIDQARLIADALPGHNFSTVINYKVAHVPVPLSEPMGRVKSGMMLHSAFAPSAEYRYAYPQISGWPERLFLLDRCFTISRFHLGNDRELVVFNTHNSAFIADQELMNRELEVIRARMLYEYDNGNYVIAGGDWNMNPPDFYPTDDYGGHFFVLSPVHIPQNFLPNGWNYAFDRSRPTNRHLDEAYQKGVTGSTTIDFFISSPNVSLISTNAIDLEFEHSDHNPVRIEVQLDLKE
jgi:endonuclease/exonuclease/phosphatase family metal-dependent hydrolase